jgi:hypothetical protein
LLRRILPYTSVVMVLAAVYTGWIFYSRRQIAAEAERQLQQKQADEEREVVEEFGGDQL